MSASTDNKCTTSSIIPTQVSIIFSCIYGVILIFVMIYSFLKLMNENEKFVNSNIFKKIKIWGLDVWKRRSCFLPILTHLVDQISDIAVAIEFGILASKTRKEDCGGINMWYLFGLTVMSMVVYRATSSYLIYLTTKSMIRIFSQLLDLELFRTLYINFILNKSSPCDPQKWITGMEATFESAPQALIQMIYLSKTKSWSESPIVLISFIWSIISIISKGVSEDKRSVKKGKEFTSEPAWYLFRFIWRFCDVSSRMFIMCLIWLSMGGTALAVVVGLEILALLILCFRTKDWGLMFSVVSIPNNLGLFIYRISSNLILLSIMTCFISINFSCPRCPSFDDREAAIFENTIIFSIFIYSWIASLILCLGFMIPFKKKASSSRNIVHMALSKDWDGLKEMHLYSGVGGDWTKELVKSIPAAFTFPSDASTACAILTVQKTETKDEDYQMLLTLAMVTKEIDHKKDAAIGYEERNEFNIKIDQLSTAALALQFAELFDVVPRSVNIVWIPAQDPMVYLRIILLYSVYDEDLKNIEFELAQSEEMEHRNANITPTYLLKQLLFACKQEIKEIITRFWDITNDITINYEIENLNEEHGLNGDIDDNGKDMVTQIDGGNDMDDDNKQSKHDANNEEEIFQQMMNDYLAHNNEEKKDEIIENKEMIIYYNDDNDKFEIKDKQSNQSNSDAL